MKTLVIGASGLLAKPVIKQMDAAGIQLRLFSRNVKPSMFEKEFEMLQGNVLNRENLENAMQGCDSIHISLSGPDESVAVNAIVEVAKQQNIRLISFVSGCTVCEENRWFDMIDKKFQAEQALIQSGIPYLIFRPTWFFESLELMIRDGKATIIGKKSIPYHWVAADDFARMVVNAYANEEYWNKTCYVYGPNEYVMKDLLEKYCRIAHPEIRKVTTTPIPVLKLIATITGNKMLKFATAMFAYFEKVSEPAIPESNYAQLSKPETDFDTWVKQRFRN